MKYKAYCNNLEDWLFDTADPFGVQRVPKTRYRCVIDVIVDTPIHEMIGCPMYCNSAYIGVLQKCERHQFSRNVYRCTVHGHARLDTRSSYRGSIDDRKINLTGDFEMEKDNIECILECYIEFRSPDPDEIQRISLGAVSGEDAASGIGRVAIARHIAERAIAEQNNHELKTH